MEIITIDLGLSKKSLVTFITYYTNSMYYLGLCPFKLVFSTKSNLKVVKYCVKQWLPQSILCLIFSILALLMTFEHIRLTNLLHATSPSECFVLVTAILGMVQTIQFSFLLHFQSGKFVDLVNFLTNSKEIQLTSKSEERIQKAKFLLTVLYTTSIINTVIPICTGVMPLFHIARFYSWEQWWRDVARYGWTNLAFQSKVFKQGQIITIWDSILGLLAIVAKLSLYEYHFLT